MNKIFKSFMQVALVVLCLMPSYSLVAMKAPGPVDPLRGMDYSKAFDHRAIDKEFRDLIEYWQCANNVFSATSLSLPPELTVDEDKEPSQQQPARHWLTRYIPWIKRSQNAYQTTPAETPGQLEEAVNKLKNDTAYYKKRVIAFKKACLDQLETARSKIISRPIKSICSMFGLTGIAATGVNLACGVKSYAGGKTLGSSIKIGVQAIRDLFEASWIYFDRPEHPLNQYEELFACIKCFIPNKLWAPITAKFSLARNSTDVAQLTCINFIEFALTLTCAQKKQPTSAPNSLENIRKAEAIRRNLEAHIDKFFKDYEPAECQIATIKFAVGCFVDSLINGNDPDRPRPNPRYQFLVSSQGLGKTEFVKKLNEWIQAEMPDYVYFKSCSAHDSAELEGGPNHHGIFLDILSSQLKEKKSGAMVLLDEPDWIDKTGGVARDAKRTFNGDLAEISTKCFGADALLLPLPPMLIFVNSNSPITENALEKRFDIGQFPKPRLQSLIKYAKKRFENNFLHDRAGILQTMADGPDRIAEVERFLKETITHGYGKQFTSFRDIQNGEELWSQVLMLLDGPAKVRKLLGGTLPIPENLSKYSSKRPIPEDLSKQGEYAPATRKFKQA